MVNFGLNSASLLGIFLAVAGAGLYFLRSVRPELSRDHDIFFAAIGLLCGAILLFQGWRLDPILQFGQVLLTGSAVFFAVESIRLRGVATEQAKRRTPIVDEKRNVSSRYKYDGYVEAELDELEPVDEPPVRGRIEGREESRNRRTQGYEDEYPRRPSIRSSSRSGSDRTGQGEQQTRRRRTRPEGSPEERTDDDWEASNNRRTNEQTDDWGSSNWEERQPRRGSSSSNRPASRRPEGSKPRRTRPSAEDSVSRRNADVEEATPTDYVEYKPVDRSRSDEDSDHPKSFE